MKNTYFPGIALFAFCGLFLPCIAFAQGADIPDPALVKPPHIILQTGIRSQWLGGNNWRSAVVSVERPFGLYQHFGLEANFLFPDFTNSQSYTYYSYEPHLTKNSFEIGLFYKIFLHGRLTGRRSHMYIAPELKFGRRNFTQYYYNDAFPLPDLPAELKYWERTSKFAIRLGAQYHIGPAILEIALPIAVEHIKTINVPVNNYLYYNNYGNSNTHLVLLPTLLLGIAL